MKKNQKIILIFCGICTFLLLTSFLNQQSDTKYLTVRTIEFYSSVFDSRIAVVDENGKIEEFDLDKFRSKTLGENAKKINDVLNNLSKKGYVLISSSASGFGTDGLVNLYIFKK